MKVRKARSLFGKSGLPRDDNYAKFIKCFYYLRVKTATTASDFAPLKTWHPMGQHPKWQALFESDFLVKS
jgi:hypothetical protein